MQGQGCEEKITKYMCDWPGCPNIATEALGCLRDLGMFCAVCKEHAPMRPIGLSRPVATFYVVRFPIVQFVSGGPAV